MLFRLTVVAAALGAAGLALAAAPIKYEITEIGRLCAAGSTENCGVFSYMYGINDAGQIAGYSHGPLITDPTDSTKLIRDYEAHAVRWDSGVLTDLGTLGASGDNDLSFGFSINNSGTVVGRSVAVVATDGTTETVENRAFYAPASGGMVDIGELAVETTLVSAADIADNGDIVGYLTARVVPGSTTAYTRGFIWSAATQTLTAISSLDATSPSYLRAVDSVAGKAVGYALKNLINQAIVVNLADPSQVIELGTLGGIASEANDINAAGLIVGRSYVTGNSSVEAFVYDPSRTPAMRGMGQLDSLMRFSQANAINIHGDVVGTAQVDAFPTQYAATFFASADPAATLINLNQRIDCAANFDDRWVLNDAVAINASGQIVGYGSKGNITRAFLLTPSTDTTPPVQCAPLEGEFENQNGGGVLGWLALPLLVILRRLRRR